MKKFSNCLFCLKAIREGDKVYALVYGDVSPGHIFTMRKDLFFGEIPRADGYADEGIYCHEDCVPVNKEKMRKLRGERKW